MRCFLALLLLLAACSPETPQEFQSEGEACMRALTCELKQIRHRQDVPLALPRLKKQFQELAFLMIAAKKSQEESPDLPWGELSVDETLNENLIAELERVYQIEGGKEMIENAQREAYLRLDAFKASFLK